MPVRIDKFMFEKLQHELGFPFKRSGILVVAFSEEEMPTVHPKIHVAKVRLYEYEDVCQQLDELAELSKTGDDMMIVRKMKMIVPEFKSNNSKYEQIDRELEKER